jgi:hypothetical protein
VIDETVLKKIHEMEKGWAAFKRTAQKEGADAMLGFRDSSNALMDIIGYHPGETHGVWNPIQRLIEHMVDKSYDPEGEAGVEEKRKRLAAAQKTRAEKAQTEDEVAEAEAAKKPFHRVKPHYDPATNLVRLGNFAFTRGGTNPLENTLKYSLDVQRKIEANTRPNKSVAGGESSLP